MKKTIKLVGIIAVVAIIGFSMAACGDDTEKNKIDPNELSVSVRDNAFSNTDELEGTVRVAFMRDQSIGLTVSDLSWLTESSFSLSFSPSDGRTANIISISKDVYNSGTVYVTLNLKRSGVPNYDGNLSPTDSVTATVSVTAGGDYKIKMNEQNRYFTF